MLCFLALIFFFSLSLSLVTAGSRKGQCARWKWRCARRWRVCDVAREAAGRARSRIRYDVRRSSHIFALPYLVGCLLCFGNSFTKFSIRFELLKELAVGPQGTGQNNGKEAARLKLVKDALIQHLRHGEYSHQSSRHSARLWQNYVAWYKNQVRHTQFLAFASLFATKITKNKCLFCGFCVCWRS
jgi:hypothetical protein